MDLTASIVTWQSVAHRHWKSSSSPTATKPAANRADTFRNSLTPLTKVWLVTELIFTKLTLTVLRSVKKFYSEFNENPTNDATMLLRFHRLTGKQKDAVTTSEVLHLLHKYSLITKITVIKTTKKTRISVIRITIGTLETMVTTLMNLLAYLVYLLSN
jgi:hypothetical protein